MDEDKGICIEPGHWVDGRVGDDASGFGHKLVLTSPCRYATGEVPLAIHRQASEVRGVARARRSASGVIVHWVVEVYQGHRTAKARVNFHDAITEMDARIPERKGKTQPGDFIAYQRLPGGKAPTA